MLRKTHQLYSGLWYVGLPLVFARLLWRSRKAPAYRLRWGERLGFIQGDVRPDGIWVHAVSVGEVLAAVPLIKLLLENYPDVPITVTTMTPTGSDRVKAIFKGKVQHMYLPYDLPSAVSRFLARVRPRVGIVMETELWPNLFQACDNANIPVVVANARLSEKSAAGYRRVTELTRRVLQSAHLIIAQSKADADRFLSLGLAPQNCQVSGSIKFDVDISQELLAQAQALRKQLGQRPKLIVASTHAGEDEPLISCYCRLKKVIPDLLLIIVPRHPERFDDVNKLCEKTGYNVVRRSHAEPNENTDIYLGDTMGELKKLFAVADVAFVAGSLKAIGGHNILEPIALNVATVVGPEMFNFAEITQLMLDVQGIIQVSCADALFEVLKDLLQNPNDSKALAMRARHVLDENKGALQRTWHAIQDVIANQENTSS